MEKRASGATIWPLRPEFILADACWGKFTEAGFSNVVTLNVFCRPAPNAGPDTEAKATAHSGSTLLSVDADSDGDRELIIGDLLYPTLVYLRNGGSSSSALIDSMDVTFPSYDTPADVTLFPASFYLDVNNDGLKDIVVSPNAKNVSYDHNNILYYQNTGSAANLNVNYQEDRKDKRDSTPGVPARGVP